MSKSKKSDNTIDKNRPLIPIGNMLRWLKEQSSYVLNRYKKEYKKLDELGLTWKEKQDLAWWIWEDYNKWVDTWFLKD